MVLGQVLTAAGTFVGVRLMTEFLSTELFGQYKLALSVISLCTGLLIRPFLQYIMRAYHDSKSEGEQSRFLAILGALFYKYVSVLGLLIAVLIILLKRAIQWDFVDIALIAILFIVQALLAFERSCAVTRNEQVAAGFLSASPAWLVPLGVVALSVWSADLTMTLAANTLVALVIYGSTRVWLRKTLRGVVSMRPAASADAPRLLPAVQYGWPLLVVGLLSWIVNESDRFLLGYFHSDHDVGIYSAAYGLIASPFTLAAGMAAQFLYPIVFRAAGSGDGARQKSVLRTMLLLTTMVSLVGVGIVWLFRVQIAWLALGLEYRAEAVELFLWLAAGYGFLGVAMSFDLAAYGANKTRNMMVAYLASAAVNVGLNLYLIPVLAAEGAAIATMGALLVYLIVMAFMYREPRYSMPEQKAIPEGNRI